MKLTLKNVFLSVGIFAFTLALAGAISVNQAQAAALCTAKAIGVWSASTTWTCTGTTDTTPTASDPVVIASGFTVTVDGMDAAASVNINNAGAATGITISGGNSLTVSGAVNLNAPSAGGTTTLAVGIGTLTVGTVGTPANLTITAGDATEISTVTLGTTGTITVHGSIAFGGDATAARLAVTGAGAISVTGDFGSNGTLTGGTSTITFNGTGAQAMGTYTTYKNVTIAGTANTVTAAGATTVGTVLTVTTGTLDLADSTFTVTGATSIASGGTLKFSSPTNLKTFTGDVTNAGIWNETAATAITFAGSLTNTGTYTASSGVHTFSGGSKTITGTGTAAISIPNLTISGATTNSGILTVSADLAGASSLTNDAGATLNIGGVSDITTLIPAASANTINYNGTGQTVHAAGTNAYWHLGFGGTGAIALPGSVGGISGNLELSNTANLTTGANLTIAGTVHVATGSTLTVGAYTLSVGGTTTIDQNGSLVFSSVTNPGKTFTGAVTVNGVWNEAYAVTPTFHAGLTNNATTWTASTGVHTFNGTAQIITGNTATVIPSVTITGTTTNNGTLTVGTALVCTAALTNGTTGVLNIGGTSSGTLAAATSGNTVVYYKTDVQTVLAPSTSYYNLTLNGTGDKTLTNIAVSNTLTVSGAIADLETTGSTAKYLTLGNVLMRAGVWGATGSGATYVNDTYFYGNAKLTVASGRKISATGDIDTTPTPTVTSSGTTTTTTTTTTTPTTTTTTTATAPGLIITAVPNAVAIPGCDNRTTGFSTTTGVSCAGNAGTGVTATYNLGTVTLKNGSRGAAVMELQRFLNDKLSLGLAVDGKLGPKTIAVIKKWQKAQGLVADGLVGAKTKAKMLATQ